MADLDRPKLYAFLSAKAKAGLTVTLKEVADQFGVSDGAAGKCLSLLTGNRVLLERKRNEFDCSRVVLLNAVEFESAASQGKSNTAYVDGLWSRLAQMEKNNETMRTRLLAAQQRIKELEAKG